MTKELINKYRPTAFDDICGHEAVVRSLAAALKKNSARTYLFTGPSGVGKTTLARIAAKVVGCESTELVEIDAATYTGIDDMREVAASLMFRPITGTVKAIIIDESHALSRQAWSSLLKVLEEPPEWGYWFLCTTEPSKVPANIRTRCFVCDLKPVSLRKLIELLSYVAGEEKLDGPLGPDLIALCAGEADGSPRQALANLALCAEAKSMKEAQRLLRSADKSVEAIQLARLLVQGASWREIQVCLAAMNNVNPESVRHVVRAYITKVILNAKDEPAAGRGLEILDAFSTPFNSFDGISPLVMACGKAVLAE